MLDKWLAAAAEEAGATGIDLDLLGPDAVSVLLDVARDAAHGVARPAAPLATFALGLALGQAGGSLAELRERAGRVVAAAGGWGGGEPGGEASGA